MNSAARRDHRRAAGGGGPNSAVPEMSRWLWPWSKCVKERVCRYLLHHYLGHFFQENLSLDQLSLDLYKGSVALRDIHLEIWVRSQAEPWKGPGVGEQRRGAQARESYWGTRHRAASGVRAPRWLLRLLPRDRLGSGCHLPGSDNDIGVGS